MSNFVKKKLETKKRKKRSISPGYNWIEKETINPLPELPLENKITADDMNYLHAMAVKPLVLSQIKVYRGTSIPPAGHQDVMALPNNEEFISAHMIWIVNDQVCSGEVYGTQATTTIDGLISSISYLYNNGGSPATLLANSTDNSAAYIRYSPSSRNIAISSSNRIGVLTSNNSANLTYVGTASSRTLRWYVITATKGGD